MMMRVLLLALVASCRAVIIEFPFDYQIGDGELYEGYAAYDDALTGAGGLPGVLISHDFWGVDGSDIFWARHWAEQGFFAFAGDVFTKFVRPDNTGDAGGNATFLRSNPEILRFRAQGAYQTMLNFPQVDREKGAAVAGYCFGVATSFELIRSNPVPQLRFAAGFHGGLADLLGTLSPGMNNDFPTNVFIQYHGAGDDAGVSDDNLAMFESNLRAQQINEWSVHQYRPAAHGFASPAGAVYNDLVATSSHFTMFQALEHVFPESNVFLDRHADYTADDDITNTHPVVGEHYNKKWQVVEQDGQFYIK